MEGDGASEVRAERRTPDAPRTMGLLALGAPFVLLAFSAALWGVQSLLTPMPFGQVVATSWPGLVGPTSAVVISLAPSCRSEVEWRALLVRYVGLLAGLLATFALVAVVSPISLGRVVAFVVVAIVIGPVMTLIARGRWLARAQ